MQRFVKVMRPKEYFFVSPPLALKQSIEIFKKLQKSKTKRSRQKVEYIIQLLKDNKLYTAFEKISINRDPKEIQDIFNYNISMLNHLCNEFDKGKTEAALWIAVILRTLLHTYYNQKEKKYSSLSIVDQLEKKVVVLISTSFSRPDSKNFMQGWDICNISNANITSISIFAGLLIKKLSMNGRGQFVADFSPMKDAFPDKNHDLILSEWFNEVIFQDLSGNMTLTRWDAIKMVANKDGGAHLDPNIPPEYESFRSKNLFKIRCNNDNVICSRNPVYVSIRQIAWEVIESFKRAGII